MTCSTCRSGGAALCDQDWNALRVAHNAAGIYWVTCPECGYYRWPWEFAPPDLGPATGLRWVQCEEAISERWWWLERDGKVVGCVHPKLRCDATIEAWAIDRVVGDRLVHTGTLADCARALIYTTQSKERKDEELGRA